MAKQLTARWWAAPLVITAMALTSIAAPVGSKDVRVLDGDTLKTRDGDYRLVGFDTPETFRAKCLQERALGERAKARLAEIVARGGLDLTEVACSCPQRALGTADCNRGRRCGKLTARGEDVGVVLIREGLARPFHCSASSCPKRQGWC